MKNPGYSAKVHYHLHFFTSSPKYVFRPCQVTRTPIEPLGSLKHAPGVGNFRMPLTVTLRSVVSPNTGHMLEFYIYSRLLLTNALPKLLLLIKIATIGELCLVLCLCNLCETILKGVKEVLYLFIVAVQSRSEAICCTHKRGLRKRIYRV